MINGHISSIEENDVVFPCIDSELLIDVDSDMYGGPLPDEFLSEKNDLSDFDGDIKLLCDYNIDPEDEAKDRESDKWSDFNDYCF